MHEHCMKNRANSKPEPRTVKVGYGLNRLRRPVRAFAFTYKHRPEELQPWRKAA
jgi:hypothetical protein